jgi:hypothetical protein
LNKFIFSCFTEDYFERFGAGWVGSLREISKFDGIIVFLSLGYKRQRVMDALKANNITVLHEDDGANRRQIVFDKISDLQRHSPGVFAYMDFDGYFNGEINPMFEESNDGNLHMCENFSMGLVCGNNEAWNSYADYRKFENACGLMPSMNDFFSSNRKIAKLDSSWNCIDMDMDHVEKAKFIHYSTGLKQVPDGIESLELSFERRFPDYCAKWKSIFFENHRPHIKLKIIGNKEN